MSRLIVGLALLAVSAACGGGGGGGGGSGEAPAAGTAGSAATGAAVVRDAAAVVVAPDAGGAAADAARDPRCADPCRFLATEALDAVAPVFQAACGAAWPAPADGDCAALDYQRNCIYAVHGYAFGKAQWREAFATKPWYQLSHTFDEAQLGAIGAANVGALRQRGRECRAGNAISAADRGRVEAFFATIAAGKPAMPRVVIDNLLVVPAAEVVHYFERSPPTYTLGPRTPLTYGQVFDEVRQALPGQRLRLINVDLSGCDPDRPDECGTCCLWLDLIFDAQDRLVAVRHGMAG